MYPICHQVLFLLQVSLQPAFCRHPDRSAMMPGIFSHPEEPLAGRDTGVREEKTQRGFLSLRAIGFHVPNPPHQVAAAGSTWLQQG